jgi:hypothetical protein
LQRLREHDKNLPTASGLGGKEDSATLDAGAEAQRVRLEEVE